MVSKATKIRLGIFRAAGSFLIILFAAAVAGNRLTQKFDRYYIMFEDYPVGGLQVGGSVNYQGIKVGRVEDIKIDPKNVRRVNITISVDGGTPIKEDTEAVLSLVGITGLKAVDIRGGSNEAPLLKPGSFIKSGSTMLDDISVRALSIAEKIDLIAANVSEITDAENRANIANILLQTGLILETTRENLSSTLASLRTVADNTARLTEGVGSSVQQLTDNLNKNMDILTGNMTSNLDSISTVTRVSLETITKSLDTELLAITSELQRSITDIGEQSTALLKDTRFHLNNIGSNGNNLILESTKHINDISMNINSSLEKVNMMLDTPEFDRLLANLGTFSGQLAEANLKDMAVDLAQTVKRVGVLVNTLNRTVVRSQDNISETLDNLRDATENLNEFARQITENPTLLLRGN
jgi:phospholipid/cholesterol/gamma-HCH transport system substrate-binding protein